MGDLVIEGRYQSRRKRTAGYEMTGQNKTKSSRKMAAKPRAELPYFCTDKGKVAVKQKEFGLSARQRQFLLLIDKKDSISKELCHKLAGAVDVEQLVDLGLLSTANKIKQARQAVKTARAAKEQPQQPPLKKEAPAKAIPPSTTASSEKAAPSKAVLSLEELGSDDDSLEHAKLIMLESLRQTSGLLAAGLMRDIENAHSITVLSQYSAKWRMTMMDSRIDKKQINIWYMQVKEIFTT